MGTTAETERRVDALASGWQETVSCVCECGPLGERRKVEMQMRIRGGNMKDLKHYPVCPSGTAYSCLLLCPPVVFFAFCRWPTFLSASSWFWCLEWTELLFMAFVLGRTLKSRAFSVTDEVLLTCCLFSIDFVEIVSFSERGSDQSSEWSCASAGYFLIIYGVIWILSCPENLPRLLNDVCDGVSEIQICAEWSYRCWVGDAENKPVLSCLWGAASGFIVSLLQLMKPRLEKQWIYWSHNGKYSNLTE